MMMTHRALSNLSQCLLSIQIKMLIQSLTKVYKIMGQRKTLGIRNKLNKLLQKSIMVQVNLRTSNLNQSCLYKSQKRKFWWSLCQNHQIVRAYSESNSVILSSCLATSLNGQIWTRAIRSLRLSSVSVRRQKTYCTIYKVRWPLLGASYLPSLEK